MENIKQHIRRHEICQSIGHSQQKEPLIPHDVLSGSWEKVGIDLVQHKSHDYLLVADFLSNVPLVRKLDNQTTAHVVSLLKTNFPDHGIPAYMFTDQGRQFMSAESQEFAIYY